MTLDKNSSFPLKFSATRTGSWEKKFLRKLVELACEQALHLGGLTRDLFWEIYFGRERPPEDWGEGVLGRAC